MSPGGARGNRHHGAVPTLMIDTAEGVRIRTEIAGIGSRQAAALLDLCVILGSYALLVILFLSARMISEGAGLEVVKDLSENVLFAMSGALTLSFPMYFAGFHVLWNGQTPGKRAMNIRAVSADGAPASTAQQILRSVFWLVDVFLSIPIPIGSILIMATPRCTRLGDLAAGTIVLHERTADSYEEPWPTESWSTREKNALGLSLGMAGRLQEEDRLLLRDAIWRRDLPRETRKSLYSKIVRSYGERLGFTPAGTSTAALKELYLFVREARSEPRRD